MENVNIEERKRKYKQLNNQLRRETDKAKEEWWKEKCEELEELNRKGRSNLLYNKVRQLYRIEQEVTKVLLKMKTEGF